MSDLRRDSAQWVDARNSTVEVTRFFGQMTLLPLTAFVYSLEIFVQLLRGIQSTADQSINAAGGAAETLGGVGSFTDDTGPQRVRHVAVGSRGGTQQMIREEERKMSEQNWSASSSSQENDAGGRDWSSSGGSDYSRRDDDWQISRECREKDPCDRLRLVRFKILFLKRNLEVAFQEEEELVSEDMTKDGFISWKIAEFIQKMSGKEVKQPGKWEDPNNYPEKAGGTVVVENEGTPEEKRYVTALPDKDKRYLRVYSQVLAWYDREKRNYERDQADVLSEIRDALKGVITVKTT